MKLGVVEAPSAPGANQLALPYPVAYSPDGSRIATGLPDGIVRTWGARTGQLVQQQRLHTGGVRGLAYSPDGIWLASGDDARILVWETMTGRIVHELRGHTKLVSCVAFNPDGSRLASSSYDRTVTIWDTTAGKALHTLRGHESVVLHISFSPDGTRLASAGSDNFVIIWELATGRELRRLVHASDAVQAVFSPDGQRLAACSADGTIKLWELTTGLEILTLRGHRTMVSCLSFSPDGTHLASGGLDGTIRIWDARPWTPEASFEREALGLLDFLFTKPLRKKDVLDYVGTAPSITPEARQMALALAERYREEADPERYYLASRAIVQPYLNHFQYRFALCQAETACGFAPGHGAYHMTLGIAHYRNGQYPAAVAKLTQAEQLRAAAAAGVVLWPTPFLQAFGVLWQVDQLRQNIPANLAFLAMAHHQLGHGKLALGYLERLQAAMKDSRWVKDEGSQGFLCEAEALIVGSATPTGK